MLLREKKLPLTLLEDPAKNKAGKQRRFNLLQVVRKLMQILCCQPA